MSRSGGNHTDSFQVERLVSGDKLRTIRARWTVNGVTGTGTLSYSIDVLGDYEITCYNTPLEADFTGSDVTACTATSSCQWSPREFRANFLSTQGEGGQGGVNLNGSGIDRTNTVIQIESFCKNPPANCPAFEDRRYRRPANLQTACRNTPMVGTTVAVWNRHPILRCGHRIFSLSLSLSLDLGAAWSRILELVRCRTPSAGSIITVGLGEQVVMDGPIPSDEGVWDQLGCSGNLSRAAQVGGH